MGHMTWPLLYRLRIRKVIWRFACLNFEDLSVFIQGLLVYKSWEYLVWFLLLWGLLRRRSKWIQTARKFEKYPIWNIAFRSSVLWWHAMAPFQWSPFGRKMFLKVSIRIYGMYVVMRRTWMSLRMQSRIHRLYRL